MQVLENQYIKNFYWINYIFKILNKINKQNKILINS
jgi:hypothetical protein